MPEARRPRGRGGDFTLEVPLDASGIKDFKPERPVKVVAYGRSGFADEATVQLNEKGTGSAVFKFAEPPGRLQILVGPANASAADMKGLQTITVDISPAQWGDRGQVVLTPVRISAYYWWWWWWWCRDFKITGRVVCPDGSPVPGATVCAYDVDWWWWWSSKDLVGCATTDVNGAFEIDFTRCCGWWPWWWWQRRFWQLEPILVDRILPLLQEDPKFSRLTPPSPQPDLGVFEQLLDSAGSQTRAQLAAGPQLQTRRAVSGTQFDASALAGLREQLVAVLPAGSQFERLKLWPWWPWWPWWDCDADIVFKVTQNCNGQDTVIIDEAIWDVRLDIPQDFTVTLVSNEQACCIRHCGPDDCPEGDCLLPSDICLDNVGSIGGNVGAVGAPIGLLNPGGGTTNSDRPYAGTVSLYGSFGDLVNADYYELNFYYAGNATPTSPLPPLPAVIPFAPLPTPAFGGLSRQVFVSPPPHWPSVSFPVTSISDGAVNHFVVETIQHYEANNGPQLWDSATHDLLAYVASQNTLANGTYFLQLTVWDRPGYAGNLTNPRILNVCAEEEVKNYWAVTIDNQVQTAGPTDINGLACGTGTIHVCTGQPDTAILQVQIVHQNGTTTTVGPCDNVCIVGTDKLHVDFAAFDPDGYLASYSLKVYYGSSLVIDLLSIAGATLAPSPIPAPWAPAAAQVGPNYGTALTQLAVSPWWSGGSMRLTVNATEAFPETCAYELQLVAEKRPIVSCYHGHAQYNASASSFTIVNPCPMPILGLAEGVVAG